MTDLATYEPATDLPVFQPQSSELRHDKTLVRRFYSKVSKTPTCWLWQGAINGKRGQWNKCGGYGKLWVNGKMRKLEGAHRVSWLIHRGDIPADMCVLHECDNRLCVNPNHLKLGTLKDNSQDMLRKARHCLDPRRGHTNGKSKLTEEAVRIIRAEYKWRTDSSILLAKRFGVGRSAILSVIYGKTWRHVK